MAALTRRTMLAGLVRRRRAAARPRLRGLAGAQHLADPRPDRRRRRRCQRAGDRRRPVAEARPADRGRAEARRGRHAGGGADRRAPRPTAICSDWIPSGYAVTAAILQVAAVSSDRRLHDHRPGDRIPVRDRDLSRIITIRNIPDLIKTAKARSEPLLGGVPGAGTPQHLLIEYFSRLAGIKIQVVPFRGGNQALTELLGKRHRLPDRSADRADRPDQVRRAACHRRHRRQALCAAAGCRHHRRGGLPRLLRHLVDGHGRAGQAAAGDHGAAQQRRSTR